MKMDRKASRVKGFTIVEMVVVIAIIGILLGVLAPSMMAYIRRSRIQAANANAKMVYNAAQTEVQKYINKDRVNPSNLSGFSGVCVLSYEHDSTDTNKANAAKDNALAAVDTTTAAGDAANTVINHVNRTVSGAREINWAVYVENYIVKSAVAAEFMSSRYIGCYSANKAKAMEMSDATYQSIYQDLVEGDEVLHGMDSSLISYYDATPAPAES